MYKQVLYNLPVLSKGQKPFKVGKPTISEYFTMFIN